MGLLWDELENRPPDRPPTPIRIALNYRNPTPSHCDVAIFINGALAGVLTLRQNEIAPFRQVISEGMTRHTENLLATERNQ